MIEFVTVIGFILTGIALVWLSKRTRLDLGEASKTTLILVPLIVFLFMSGRIAQFEGFGLKATFRELGTKSAIETARSSDLATISNQANPADFRNEANWAFCRPYYLLTDGSAKIKAKPDELDKEAVLHIASAIRHSIVCGKFLALIVVDKDRKPIGFFPRDHFLELLRIVLVGYNGFTVDGDAAFQQVRGSELGVILQNPEIRANSDDASRNTVPGSEAIGSVYKKIIAANADIALITDRLGRFDGIITRRAIEGKVIDGLLTASK